MQEKIDALVQEATQRIEAADDLETLDALRVHYLGRKGALTQLLRGLGEMPADERPAAGQALNRAKIAVQQSVDARQESLRSERDAKPFTGDLTLPPRGALRGSLHPVHEVVEEICDIFHGLGFSRVHGPEVELDALNFTALNFPDDHPARDLDRKSTRLNSSHYS